MITRVDHYVLMIHCLLASCCIIYQCEAGQEVTLRSSLALMAMLWLIVTAAMLYVREDWCLSTQEGDNRALRGLLVAGT